MTVIRDDLHAITGKQFDGTLEIRSQVLRPGEHLPGAVTPWAHVIPIKAGKFETPDLDPGPAVLTITSGSWSPEPWEINIPDSEEPLSLTAALEMYSEYEPGVISEAWQAANQARSHADRAESARDGAVTAADRAETAAADVEQVMGNAADQIRDAVADDADRAEQAATAAEADASATAADRVQTGLDRTQVGEDSASAASDAGRAETAAGTAGDHAAAAEGHAGDAEGHASAAAQSATAAGQDAAATAADRTQTGLDRTAAGEDAAAAADAAGHAGTAAATAGDHATAASGHAETAEGHASAAAQSATDAAQDATATAADRVQTGLDRTQTGLDAAATAADRVQTGEDATRAETAATTAGQHAEDADTARAGAVTAQEAAEQAATNAQQGAPPGGWPKEDLHEDVRDSLTRADSALQSMPSATDQTRGGIRLRGDLAGDAEYPTVPGLADKADLDESGKVPESQLPAVKPADGWAKTDLDAGVRTSLDSADTALQSVAWEDVEDRPAEFPPEPIPASKISDATPSGLQVLTGSVAQALAALGAVAAADIAALVQQHRPPGLTHSGEGPPPSSIPEAKVGDFWLDESTMDYYRIEAI